MMLAAAEILARELECAPRIVDDATFEQLTSDGAFALAIDAIRALDDSAEGVAVAAATFDRAAVMPVAASTAASIAISGTTVLAWEIATIGAQAGSVWLPRAAGGGFDLESGAAGR